jgi:hypothetical protein
MDRFYGVLDKDSGTVEQLQNIKDWLILNLDSLIHWKMIVFTPAIAANYGIPTKIKPQNIIQ